MYIASITNNLVITILIIITLSCSPKIVTKSSKVKYPNRSEFYYEPFAIFELDTINRAQFIKLGQIEIKDNGLTLICDYETVKRIAKDEALKLGGNSYVITEHKRPNQWSTCHRIKADVLLISNPKEHEREIIWHKNRQLEISDFKGLTDKRPFTAATASSFRINFVGRVASPKKYKLTVETFFDCYSSYFKASESDSDVLNHEQVHFDITELYARKFIERVQKERLDLNQLFEKQEIILNEVWRETQIKQDEYDSEVYADINKQAKWNKWIQEELEKYKNYSLKNITINLNK